MKPSFGRIQDSKRAFRQKLAHAPIAQKLRMLDQLRLRTLAIKNAARDYRKTPGQLLNKHDNLVGKALVVGKESRR